MNHKQFSSKGGKAGRGAAKARTAEQARAAVMARWSKPLKTKLVTAKPNGGLHQRMVRRLANCPFCLNDILEIKRAGHTKQTSTMVSCPRCGCHGPMAENKRAAEKWWGYKPKQKHNQDEIEEQLERICR